jgi:hypothetical protein
MRADANAERIHGFLRELGRHAGTGDRVYLTGGATAVLIGWRDSTRDVDVRLEGDEDRLLHAIATLKNELDINVELASPLEFLPAPDDWRERSAHVGRFGSLDVFHIAFPLQALAKLQRGFDEDLGDVAAMLERGLTTKRELAETLAAIAPALYRFPSVDADRLTAAVEALTES